MKSRPILSFALAALVLILAVGAMVSTRHDGDVSQETEPPQWMEELRSLQVAGWTSRELPVAETEVLYKVVQGKLRYDDVVYVEFSSGFSQFAVFAAYWTPGKVDARTVNAHTPDTCWVANGWQPVMKVSDFRGPPHKDRLQPGQYRCFEALGNKQYVAFWHLVGGESIPLWRRGFPKPSFLWRVLVSNRELRRAEQVFLRISSPEPFEKLWEEEAFRKVIELLSSEGLGDKDQTSRRQISVSVAPSDQGYN